METMNRYENRKGLRMKTKLSAKLFLTSATAALSLVLALPAVGSVEITPIGNPTWEPVDFHLFSAPVGTPETGFIEFALTAMSILAPPGHVGHDQIGIGPGAPHDPPYDSELADGLANLGIADKEVFTVPEFSFPNAVWLVWMVVPAAGAPTGSSPDFDNGPIIPNSICPITFSGVTLRNGELFDPYWASETPALNVLDPPYEGDGHSHFPEFNADAWELGVIATDPDGMYEYQFTVVDNAGNGWNIITRFEVVPPPEPHDFAVTAFKAPTKISLSPGKPPKPGKLQVTIQNLGPHAETIPDLATLEELVTFDIESLGDCPSPVPTLVPPKSFPIVLAPNKTLKLSYLVTIDCPNDPLPSGKTDSAHADYRFTVRVDHVALNGEADTNPGNDDCPRAPNGDDPGCGGKNSDGTLGAPLLADVAQK